MRNYGITNREDSWGCRIKVEVKFAIISNSVHPIRSLIFQKVKFIGINDTKKLPNGWFIAAVFSA